MKPHYFILIIFFIIISCKNTKDKGSENTTDSYSILDQKYPEDKSAGLIVMNEFGEEERVPPNHYNLSMVRLIANYESYDGKIVGVNGYLNLEFEGDAIYLNKGDYQNNIFKNGIWVNFKDESDTLNLKKYTGKYVWLLGRFKAYNGSGGHLGLWSGEFENILDIRSIDYNNKN